MGYRLWFDEGIHRETNGRRKWPTLKRLREFIVFVDAAMRYRRQETFLTR